MRTLHLRQFLMLQRVCWFPRALFDARDEREHVRRWTRWAHCVWLGAIRSEGQVAASIRLPAPRVIARGMVVSLALLLGAGLGRDAVAQDRPTEALPDWVETLGYRSSEVLALGIDRFGCPTVGATINGVTTDLVFDTGNMSGMSLGPRVARKASLQKLRETTAYDSAGAAVGKFNTYLARDVVVLNRTWREQEVHELGDDRLPGLLGPKYVLGQRFTLDYPRRLLALSSAPAPPLEPETTALPLIAVGDLDGMLVVAGRVGDREVFVQIDTGKSRTCVDPALARALSLSRRNEGRNQGYAVDGIQLGRMSFDVPNAKAVSFVGISAGLPKPIEVAIGSDILSQVIFTVDYPNNRVILGR